MQYHFGTYCNYTHQHECRGFQGFHRWNFFDAMMWLWIPSLKYYDHSFKTHYAQTAQYKNLLPVSSVPQISVSSSLLLSFPGYESLGAATSPIGPLNWCLLSVWFSQTSSPSCCCHVARSWCRWCFRRSLPQLHSFRNYLLRHLFHSFARCSGILFETICCTRLSCSS